MFALLPFSKGGGGKGYDGNVVIPAPKGLHNITPVGGQKGYLAWKALVTDNLTDEGREELRALLHWAEKQDEPNNKLLKSLQRLQ